MSNALEIYGQHEGGGLPASLGARDVEVQETLAKTTRKGLIAVAVLVFGIGGMMAFLPMAGAVIATGEVSVETQVKQISHPFGGVAADILVSDGDRVNEGDVLIRLDDTVAGAAAEFSELSLDQLLAREARLRALRDGAGAITFPKELLDRANEPGVAALLADERSGHALERQARADLARQLQARIAQTQATIASSTSRIDALRRQDQLIGEELAQTRELYEDRLSTLDRLNALERAAVDLDANRSAAQASITEAQARISELRTQSQSLSSEARSRAAIELAQVQQLIADQRQREVTASDANDRTAIRAPQDGIVNGLAIKTIGGVVPAGQVLLELVPANDRLVVEAFVEPTDIDQVTVGAPATLRFTSLSMRTTPEINGRVAQVDVDRSTDPVTGVSYYSARVEIADEEFARLGDIKLAVGMPVEVFIQTGERTILSYILRPLSDQIKRALRE